MHRLFTLLAFLAAGLGLAVLFAGADIEATELGGRLLQNVPLAHGGWAAGLLMGLALAWLATLDWRNWPQRLSVWLKVQRRRLGLAVLGSIFAGILLFF